MPKSYLNKGTVQLPIQIDDRVRPQIQEVQLYVKDGPQAPWILKDKVPGTQPSFTFRTTKEGEYWFSVVTVDRNGRSLPADVSKEPPGLIVVIDSTPPQAEVQVMPSTPEGQPIRCEVHDTYPDPSKTRFFYQTRDQIWRSLECLTGQPDTFCIPAQAAHTGMIRVVASDLAGNSTTREFNLATAPMAASNTGPALKSVSNVVLVETASEKIPLPPALPDFVAAASKGPMLGASNENVSSISERVDLAAKPTPFPLPQGPIMEPAPKVPFSMPSGPEIRTVADATPMVAAKQPEATAKRHLVNNTHVFLDYQIEQTGPSGVGRVEIWHTRDMGQSWQKLSEDANRKGQAEIDLPGEGVYGLTIIVSNGRGFGANPPQPGDTPEWWIEVDTTKPRAELLNVRNNPNGDDGTLHITWSASDKNLQGEPIDLFCAVHRQGPWIPIATGLRNDGLYRWNPAASIGTHAFIRLTVHDQAGNSASCESVQPVPLDDLSRPRGRLVGVTTTPRTVLGHNPGPLPPTGN